MVAMPLSYSNFNGRPFGVCAFASRGQEGILIQLMSAWANVFNKERVLPTRLAGEPPDSSEKEEL
jgi:amidase